MNKTLYYIHDPMCSWCYAFSNAYEQLIETLPAEIEVIRLLGGLAADSNEIMPMLTREMVKQNWVRIAQLDLGIEFNYDFWEKCQPRRSTYPACRAIIAAREQGTEYDFSMTRQIQKAYYQQARNPSNNETLIELADEIGLDTDRFSQLLIADNTQQCLLDEITAVQRLNVPGFPSLVLQKNNILEPILVNYTNANTMLTQIMN